MQGTQVWSLVQKDPTCLRATKPKSQNYRSPCTITSEVTIMRRPGTAMESSPCSPQLEKWRAQQRKPSTAKKNNYKLSAKPSHAFLDSEELSLCLFNTFSFFRLQMKWPFLQTAPNITALCFRSPHPSSQTFLPVQLSSFLDCGLQESRLCTFDPLSTPHSQLSTLVHAQYLVNKWTKMRMSWDLGIHEGEWDWRPAAGKKWWWCTIQCLGCW